MKQNTFQSIDSLFSQTFGTAMGNSLSYFIANTFLSNFKTNASKILNYFRRIWLRYVDYSFDILTKIKIFHILSHIFSLTMKL